ncbi:MAG: hypothetical protein RIB93_01650 [Coleofasciculus sp. D1-CHI-01]|uniref:hypothetical protein n=1 Tax=Coleofasciculus sp. D1-CHI-01 TaxID=3068482 RepID=UPI0033006249
MDKQAYLRKFSIPSAGIRTYDRVCDRSVPVASETQKPNYHFFDRAGQLTWQGDAVAMQRTLRDEW